MPQLSPINSQAFLESARAIAGAANVLSTANETEGYLTDWTRQYSGEALAVVKPGNTEEVAQLVQLCSKNSVAVVPQGGRTGLCGGGVPLAGQPAIVLSLARMNAIRQLDETARTVVVEAGVVLENLHNKAREHHLIFPLMFGARGSCTIGGNLSTNAGGSNVVRYGNTRELCIGIEAVMPDGSVLNALTGLRKDNTGYDLKNLLIGAEGTLGIITAAVFKLYPQPLIRATAFVSVQSVDTAIDLLNRIQDASGTAVEAFEYMPGTVVDVIRRVFPDIPPPLSESPATGILIEIASSRPLDAVTLEDGSQHLSNQLLEILGELMESGQVLDAVVAQSERQRADLWRLRESTLEAITENGPAYHLDISLGLSKISTFITDMDACCKALGFQPLTIGHLGDGNLHYALTAATGHQWNTLPLADAKQAAFALLAKLQGSFSAEHGVGQSKLDAMSAHKEPSQLAVMQRIKRSLDPQNMMNPGKLIPFE